MATHTPENNYIPIDGHPDLFFDTSTPFVQISPIDHPDPTKAGQGAMLIKTPHGYADPNRIIHIETAEKIGRLLGVFADP